MEGVPADKDDAANEEHSTVNELPPIPAYADGPTRQCPISGPLLLGEEYLNEGIEVIQSIQRRSGARSALERHIRVRRRLASTLHRPLIVISENVLHGSHA